MMTTAVLYVIFITVLIVYLIAREGERNARVRGAIELAKHVGADAADVAEALGINQAEVKAVWHE